MEGRFDRSLIAKCIPSKVHPSDTISFTVFSMASSVTVDSSTKRYRSPTAGSVPEGLRDRIRGAGVV